MDSTLFYRPRYTPPRPPAPVHVRTTSRGAALDALEYGPVLSRARMGELTLLGETTLRHAIRQLSREGVLTPQSGRNAATVSVARYSALPILEVSDHRLTWRLCDTVGRSVCATVRDRGRFRTLEDDFTALMGQVATILGGGTCGLSKTVPLQPPILLCPNGRDFDRLPLLLPLTEQPTAILPPEEATAIELQYLPAAQETETILLIHRGEEFSTSRITLFTRRVARDFQSPFVPSPLMNNLDEALRAYGGLSNRDLTPHPSFHPEPLADFLRDLCRFVRLTCVVVESDRPGETAANLRAALPTGVKLVRARHALNTPSLAHRGALRISRRALWDRMEETSIP